jgi:hypothetical protein
MKFIAKLVVFALPIFLFMGIYLFVLPIDCFCFRTLEALIVHSQSLPGFFYSNYRIERNEVGDLGLDTVYAQRRHVIWQTDKLGFRNLPEVTPQNADLVIVGDSFVFGSGLSQEQMLAQALSRRTGLRIYSYATADLNQFLDDPRFRNVRSRTVVYAGRENTMALIPVRGPGRPWGPSRRPLMQEWTILIDRLSKMIPVRAAQSRIERKLSQLWNFFVYHERSGLDEKYQLALDGSMIFRKSDIPAAKIFGETKRFAIRMRAYKMEFKRRGIRLIILIIPEDTTLYYSRIPLPSRPSHPEKAVRALQEAGVEAVDIAHPFYSVADDEMLCQRDDVHWSPAAVELAAERVQRYLANTAPAKSPAILH